MTSPVSVYCAHTEMAPIGSLVPNPRNPNTHPASQVKLLAHIIDAQGWRAPITVSNRSGFITKGHGRLLAAQQLGLTEVPVDRQDYADEASEWADMVADNRIAELAEIDDTALKDLIQELDTGEIDLTLTGFTEDDLARMLAPLVEPSLDDVPPPPKDPVTKPGDLWLLGDHRLLCGDSTNQKDVARVLNGENVDVLWSDPPYGLGGYSGRSGKHKDVAGDDAQDSVIEGFYSVGTARETYICCEFKTYKHVLASRGVPRSCIVWAKPSFGMGKGYRRQHEFICYWGNFDSTSESDLWQIGRDGGYDHPTQKPVALVARALHNSGAPGAVVFDPFCGSGPSIAAAEQLGQKLRAIELDPAYCDVIVERWETLTGKKAVLDEPRG